MLFGANLNIRRCTSIEFQENTMGCPTSRWCDPFTRKRVTRGMGGKGRDTGRSRTLTTVSIQVR